MSSMKEKAAELARSIELSRSQLGDIGGEITSQYAQDTKALLSETKAQYNKLFEKSLKHIESVHKLMVTTDERFAQLAAAIAKLNDIETT